MLGVGREGKMEAAPGLPPSPSRLPSPHAGHNKAVRPRSGGGGPLFPVGEEEDDEKGFGGGG